MERREELIRELLALLPRGVVKIAYPWADRVTEETYRLVKEEDGTMTLQAQQFITDQMTILCGEVNPLDSLAEAEARRKKDASSAQKERMAAQRELDALMLKFSSLQDERDTLAMDLEDITRRVEDLYDRLHPRAEPSAEEAKLIEDIGLETSRVVHRTLTEDGIARKILPPRDVPTTEFVDEGGPGGETDA